MFQFEEGEIFLVDKPLDWTSFDAVNLLRAVIRRYHGIKKLKIGHAGTLDPLATGLLIICTGKNTKKIEDFQAKVKTYTGTFLLGKTTPTYDCESKPNASFSTDDITPEMLETTRLSFIGEILQRPPKFSAIKINGKRAFDYARTDKEIEMKERRITIYDFKLDTTNFPEIGFEVVCSKGTYIRSLAHDFGQRLNNGAYLTSLRRTKIGDFDVANALTLDALRDKIILEGADTASEEYRLKEKDKKHEYKVFSAEKRD